MTDQNNAAQAAEKEIDAIMEQAQVFASAWAFFGGPFDQGDGKEQAELEEARLREVVRDALSKLRAPVADERAAFEAFQRGVGLNELYLERHPESGQYMWTATKESWETWQARAALASAPVAGEAQEPVAWKVYDAGLNKHMLTDNPKVAEMLREEGGGNVVRPLVYGDAAPQAGEAECSCPSGNGSLRHPCAVHGGDHFRDATKMVGASEAAGIEEAFAGIDGLVELRNASLEEAATAVEARIGVGEPGIDTLELDRETQECANAIRALKSQSAALSAQPGAQKNCNCATCRPHSVEMRMILCEVCGDKRCPHAADHRNECTSHPKQHNDGGADAI